ncbi:MAG: hypothetical protein EBR84_02045 [Actinobacteria bacterium]|nr:hypothetical protein [Actinomycetota bacterium]
MSEIEIGGQKRAKVSYSFDDVSLVPSRRTRDTSLVSLGWKIDAYTSNTNYCLQINCNLDM